jgi:hypothetical protein
MRLKFNLAVNLKLHTNLEKKINEKSSTTFFYYFYLHYLYCLNSKKVVFKKNQCGVRYSEHNDQDIKLFRNS